MKNRLRLLLALLPALAFSHANAQTVNPLFHHIPTDADQVYHINLATIGPKVDWLAVSSLVKNRNFSKGTKLPFDPMSILNSGIDVHQDIILIRSNVYHIDSFKYTIFVLHLTDSAKFVAFLQSAGHGFHFLRMPGHERAGVYSKESWAWTDKLAVGVLATAPNPMFASLTDASKSSRHSNPPSPQYLARKAVTALHGVANSFFTTDSRFIAGLSNDGDMQLWSRHAANLSAMNKILQTTPAAKFGGIMQMLARSSAAPTISTLRFEPGKISFNVVKYVSPGELSSLQHLVGQGFSSDMISAVPSGSLIGMMAMHYNIDVMMDTLKRYMPMDSVNEMLAKKGLSIQDIFKAFKGDFMVIARNPDKNATGSAAGKPGIFVMLSIADRPAFTRITKGMNIPDAATPADTASTDTSNHKLKMFYAVHNDIAVIGGNRQQVNDFFNHPAGSPNPAERLLLDASQPGMFNFGVDMHSVADLLTPMLTKADTIGAKNQAVLDAIRQMDVLLMSSGIIKDGTMVSDFQLRMTDKDKNGLSSLIDIFGKMSKSSGNAAK